MGRRKRLRPITRRLREGSWLAERVQAGLGAVSGKDKGCVSKGLRKRFSESLRLDDALKEAYPDDPRWDYLLGDATKDRILALEIHPATNRHVKHVVAKKEAAARQLADHLTDGVWRWFWAASGTVDFPPRSKYCTQLAQKGIIFVGRVLQQRHLEG